ncbi:CCCH zinc finger DNA binding protein [Rhodotorula toruloides]|uniref:CCCH zinc finger DNA binding protein n=1 Tax=Rhodotorula toruloides TaxID=5286 RepID=A0A511KPP6_RHOTO|nr:CCCH zinc finger DNA binding protein [Rhodotorula toruloides]
MASQPDSPADPQAAPSQLFDSYVYYAAEAARIARDACHGKDTLVSRIRDLEIELQELRLGHEKAVKSARDAQKQLDVGDQVVFCCLDGDGCIFERSLIQKGRDGGREAARRLIEHIHDYAIERGYKGQLSIVVHIFVNKVGLGKVLQACGIADEATFSAFLLGVNAAHPLVLVSDVGPSKEASDAKINSSIRLFAKFPSTKLILAGAAHDGGYAHLFSELETESPQLAEKVTLLKSYTDLAFEIKRLNLRTTYFNGLFEAKKLVSYATLGTPGMPPTTPRKSPVPPPSTTPGGGLKTPKMVKKDSYTGNNSTVKKTNAAIGAAWAEPDEFRRDDGFTKVVKLRPIDPSKPLHKQVPPVCNRHYLVPPCRDGDACRYGHQYALTTAQLLELGQNAKKSPCAYALKGKQCTADNCPLGHTCPRGKDCRYGMKCKFSAPGMHPPGTKGRTDTTAYRGPDVGPSAVSARRNGKATNGYGKENRPSSDDYDSESDGFETTSSID